MHEIFQAHNMDHACYMHDVPHYIILIRSRCIVNSKMRDSEKVSVLKVINLKIANAFVGGGGGGGGNSLSNIYM